MTTRQLYEAYLIPKSLQLHMLRVGALADILLAQWTGPIIDSHSIITACLFHDAAKPMTFDLSQQTKFGMSPQDIEQLKILQTRLKTYGDDEHQATIKMCKEIGLDPTVIRLIDNLEWANISRLLTANDISSLVPIYCDMRIGPDGILPLAERLNELQKRTSAAEFEANIKNGQLVEQEIMKNVSLDVNAITNQQINDEFEKLLNFKVGGIILY